MLTTSEVEQIKSSCSRLPRGRDCREKDYIANLLLTVIDFQLEDEVVGAAMEHFRAHHGLTVTHHGDLVNLVASFADTKRGNLALAKTLWNNGWWTRAQLLRPLLIFLEGERATDRTGLLRWLRRSDFDQDIQGRVRTEYHSLGPVVYHGLCLRVGPDTIKPLPHLCQYVAEIVGRQIEPEAVVSVLTRIAKELGRKCFELDSAIWSAVNPGR